MPQHDPSVDEFLMLPADDIKYEALSLATLVGLSTQTVDPFIATSALGELAQRDSSTTRTVARRILEATLWDPHLSAYALSLLYDRDREGALESIATLLRDSTDPVVLTAVMESLLSDVQALATPGGELARRVASQVAAMQSGSFRDPELRVRFVDVVRRLPAHPKDS